MPPLLIDAAILILLPALLVYAVAQLTKSRGQFSLRSLLITLTLVAVLLGLLRFTRMNIPALIIFCVIAAFGVGGYVYKFKDAVSTYRTPNRPPEDLP